MESNLGHGKKEWALIQVGKTTTTTNTSLVGVFLWCLRLLLVVCLLVVIIVLQLHKSFICILDNNKGLNHL